MISRLPAFEKGKAYREGGDWRFTLLEDVSVHLDLPLDEVISFRDKHGIERARLARNKFTVRRGYAWDGCSPKKRFAMLWLGTPDPPCTRLASLVHDAMYQFIATRHFPLSRRDADACFYDLMHIPGFLLAGVFHGAVRCFGGFAAADASRNGCWSKLIQPVLPAKSNNPAA